MALTACSFSIGSTPEPSSEPTRDAQELNADALAAYVEAERATMPAVMEQYPGLYADASVDGTFEESDGDGDLPAGTYAVVWYDYTYANPLDWSTATVALEGQRSTFDDLCESTVFPAMRRAGITGPLGAVWSYKDVTSESGPMWSHTCSDE